MLFPRLIAFAEKGWTIHSLTYKSFRDRMLAQSDFLAEQGVAYTPIKEANPNIFKRGLTYAFGLQNRIKKITGDSKE